MTPRRLVFVLVFTLAALVPRPALAHGGFWDWLEELSGPGPFRGVMFDVRPLCFVAAERAGTTSEQATGYGNPFRSGANLPPAQLVCQANHAVTDPQTNIRYRLAGYMEVRGGIAWSDSQPLFSDRPGELTGVVRAQAGQLFFMRQVDRAVALGAGAGAIHFSGSTVPGGPTRFVMTPLAVAFSPLKLFMADDRPGGGFITLRFDEVAIRGNLRAADFNPASTSTFQSKRVDLVGSFAITVDVLAFKKK